MPRVVAGEAGGIPLVAPAGQETRPTLDRTKEAMFSAITARISLSGASVADFYAGSGQLGIEAISRGASLAIFVERHAKARAIIKQNLLKTKFSDRAKILGMDAKRALQDFLEQGLRFDLILLDPPYGEAKNAFIKLCDDGLAGLLKEGALVVLEHASASEAPENVRDLKLIKRCKYGTAMVSFYSSLEAGGIA